MFHKIAVLRGWLALALVALAAGRVPAQTFATLMAFSGTNGYYPNDGLTLDGSTLYGMTQDGGTSYKGNIFSLQTSGSGYQNLFSFSGSNGQTPLGNLTLGNATLYGMTQMGGQYGDGSIFSIGTNGSGFKTLFSFSGANGLYPRGSLAISGSTLYGLTSGGGALSNGEIFSIGTNGTGFQGLISFTGSGGAYPGDYPLADLTLNNSMLYGTTQWGGSANRGVAFAVNTSGGGYTLLHTFTGASSGMPNGDLTLVGSTLYGTTYYGGVNGVGSIFSVNTDGSGYHDLYSFGPTSGGASATGPGMTLTADGPVLFGSGGNGANNLGCIFSFDTTDNAYDDLFDFTNTNHDAGGSLTLGNSILYGMGQEGGPLWDGNVFSLTLQPTPEPSTFALLGTALTGWLACRWRRRGLDRTAAL